MKRQEKWKHLTEIDEKLLGGGTDFTEAHDLLDRREAAIRDLSASAESPEELDDLMARNRRLTEWMLHQRRVTLIEAAAVEQHLRFLERSGEAVSTGERFVALG
jgi:hypothetical protein